jgi:hypothetical protein
MDEGRSNLARRKIIAGEIADCCSSTKADYGRHIPRGLSLLHASLRARQLPAQRVRFRLRRGLLHPQGFEIRLGHHELQLQAQLAQLALEPLGLAPGLGQVARRDHAREGLPQGVDLVEVLLGGELEVHCPAMGGAEEEQGTDL